MTLARAIGALGGRISTTPFEGVSERLPTGSPEIRQDGLVLAYDMRTLAASGALRDVSGAGNDGALVGTEVVPGPFGPALRFQEVSDFIRLPGRRSLQTRGPISIAVWIRLARTRLHQHVVAYDDLYTLWIDAKDRIHFADTRENAFESETGAVEAGEWVPIVATFAGRPGTAVSDRNIAVHLGGEPLAGDRFGVWSPGRPVVGYVGKESHDAGADHPLMAEVAAVLIFRRAISLAEIQAFGRTSPSTDAMAPATWERHPGRLRSPLPGTPVVTESATAQSQELNSAPSVLVNPSIDPVALRWQTGAEFEEEWGSVSLREGGGRDRPRVVRITNILPPYRLRVLETLHASPQVRFETWLMAASERNRRWPVPSTPGIRTFRDWGLDLSHRNLPIAHFNPGMMRELSAHPPDLVILGGYDHPTTVSIGLLLNQLGIPFLLSSESISIRDSIVGRWAPFVVRKLARTCAGAIVPGRATRDHLRQLGVREDRIFVAPNSVDVDRFVPARSPEEKGAVRLLLGLPDRTLCLYVGRLTEDKGVLDLLEAFRSLRADERLLHLVLVGEGPLRERIETTAAGDPALKRSLTLVGYASEELLPKYYMAADIFVLPTWRDVWGLVLNEAMSAGLAVVSSGGASGAWDLIEDGVSGLIVPRRRPRDLADAILQLHENPESRRLMGRRARERMVNGFSPRHQAMGFLHAIMTTLARLGRAGAAQEALEEAS